MKSNVAKAAAITVAALAVAGCGSSGLKQQQKPPASTQQADAASQPALAESSSGTETVKKLNYVLPVATIQLAQPLAQYTVYVNTLLRKLRPRLAALQSATDSGDLTAAERAWLPAHVTYLEIGQDDAAYGSFGDLGQQIDGLAAGLPNTTANPRFTGFHKVELDLWRHHDVATAARDTKQLITFVNRLTPKTVAADLPLSALSVDGWVLRCHEILEDALRDSLTGDDDYGSSSDLATLAADTKATKEMLHVLAPLIRPRGATIVPQATVDLQTLDQTIGAAGGSDARASFVAVPVRRRQAIDEAVGAALETLAPVSEILQVAAPGS
jgi:iron uptake system EfeUOB component EfeO/EfeM